MHGENKEKTVYWNLEKEGSFSIFKCGKLNNKK